MIVILNSSPLISLAVAGKLNMLEKLYKEIYVPTAVYEEVARSDKPFSRELRIFLTGRIKNIKNKMAIEMLLSDIGAGEAETIILALEQQPDIVLIDDLKTRKFAKIRGVKITGTMGVLLEAKKEGLIKEIKPLISELLSRNIRISTKIIEITMQAAHEA